MGQSHGKIGSVKGKKGDKRSKYKKVDKPEPYVGEKNLKNGKAGPVMKPGMFIKHHTRNFSEVYQGIKVLGKGSFGEVILCKQRSTGVQQAVKVISKKSLKKDADPQSLLKEVELLKSLDHPNIMKLYGIIEEENYYYLIGELYSGGELFDEIITRKRCSEKDACIVMKQVLSGIAYMHRVNIVHRDLKPENLLLASPGALDNLKIIDFGLSTYFSVEGRKMRDKIGTAYYIAPEVLGGQYDEKCDVWSAGVILYILLSGCPPFYGSTEAEILRRVESGKYSFNMAQWRRVSDDAKDLIKRLLTFNAANRPNCRDVLDHPWLKIVDYSDDLPALESTLINITQFRGGQRLADAAMLYMGSKLTTAEETKELFNVFKKLDKNGDGQLDISELKAGYRELLKMKGQNIEEMNEETIAAEVAQILEEVDFDKNGYIDYSEFVTVSMDREALLSESRLKTSFEQFDTDGSGRISHEELLNSLSIAGLDHDACKKILDEADVNKDGEIDFEEFTLLLKRIAQVS